MKVLLLFQFLGLFILIANGYKYLVYNVKFGRSHKIYMNRIVETLGEGGHEVTSYQPIYSNEFNDTVKFATIINRELTYPIDFDDSFMHKFAWTDAGFKEVIQMFPKFMGDFIKFTVNNCRDQLQDEDMMNRLKEENFDLFITEYYDLCGLVIGHKLGIKKHILIFSLQMPYVADVILGLPSTSSFVPDLYTSLTPKMTMMQRFQNLVSSHFIFHQLTKPLSNAIDRMAQELVDPDFNYLKKASDSSLIFVSTDEMLDFARPITHKVIYIGGLVGLHDIKDEKSKQLPEKWDKVFKEAKRGVIYMSFGTMAPSYIMPENIKTAFLEAFNEFKDITFIWKYEKPEHEIAKNYPNVVTSSWLPQKQILSHPKTLLFISHGGMNSLNECLYLEKPILAIPLFGDQFRNAQTVKWHGFGEILEKSNLTKETIVENIQKIIENKSYRTKAQEMNHVLTSKPFSAKELFLKNVEFVTKFNSHHHLTLYSTNLTFIEMYNLDLLAIAFILTLTFAYLFYRFLKFLVCRSFKLMKTKIGYKSIKLE